MKKCMSKVGRQFCHGPGGVAVLQGTYTLDGTTGEVAQTSYPEISGLLSGLTLFEGLG